MIRLEGLFNKITHEINILTNEDNGYTENDAFLKMCYDSLGEMYEQNELSISHYDSVQYDMKIITFHQRKHEKYKKHKNATNNKSKGSK